MEITMIYNEELNAWKTKKFIFDSVVDIMLIDIDLQPELTKEEILDNVISYVKSKRREIEENIVTSLWDTYNNNWTNIEDGNLHLSKEEFLSKLILSGINYEIEDVDEFVYYLYYTDSDMFSGHSVEVFIDSNMEISSEIIG